MRWRNPKAVLPKENQAIFAMLNPHKWRGSLVGSATSIQIVAGWYWSDRLANNDEYGHGSLTYQFNFNDRDEHIIAWIPVEEMTMPDWNIDD